MIKKITFLTLLIAGFGVAQTPSLEWVSQFGSTGLDEGFAITKDLNNDLIIAGWFQGTIDFDPGPNIFNLTAGGDNDIFIVKLDSEGNFIWAVQNLGSQTSRAAAISLITDSVGGIYVTGYFNGSVDFDPGPGTLSFQGANGAIFNQKLDTNGNLIWAHEIDDSSLQKGISVELDNNNNVIITGIFTGTVDFDPGPNVYEIQGGLGDRQIFILKLNNDGQFIWAKHLVGFPDSDLSQRVKVDSNNNIYIAGYFDGIMEFDPGPIEYWVYPEGLTDFFVLKLNEHGEFVWVKNIGASNHGARATDLAIDQDDNLYFSGNFSGTVDFDPGVGVEFLTANYFDKFLLKLDSNAEFVWVRQLSDNTTSSVSAEYETSLTIKNNFIYVTGKFEETMDFDPSTTEDDIIAINQQDIFITQYDSIGNFIWAEGFGGSGNEKGTSIIVDDFGYIYTTGSFEETIDFDPSSNEENLSSLGNRDIFVLKLGVETLSNNKLDKISVSKLYPNPTDGRFKIELSRRVSLIKVLIYDTLGRNISSFSLNNTSNILLEIKGRSGLYNIHLILPEQTITLPVIKI